MLLFGAMVTLVWSMLRRVGGDVLADPSDIPLLRDLIALRRTLERYPPLPQAYLTP
jgi:hypothetical protein